MSRKIKLNQVWQEEVLLEFSRGGSSDLIVASTFISTPLKMFIVYVLLSLKDKKCYIGFTSNLERRLIEHNSGKVKSTKNRKPFELAYSVEFALKVEAMNREKFFKSGKGREFLNSIGK